MLLNRRTMLSASLAAIALGSVGCKKTKTTVIVKNEAAEALSIDAHAGGQTLSAKNIQPGHQVKRIFHSNAKVGTAEPVTGTATLKGMPAVDLAVALAGMPVIAGFTNTITVTDVAVTLVVT
jgi:hypothetical protein